MLFPARKARSCTTWKSQGSGGVLRTDLQQVGLQLHREPFSACLCLEQVCPQGRNEARLQRVVPDESLCYLAAPIGCVDTADVQLFAIEVEVHLQDDRRGGAHSSCWRSPLSLGLRWRHGGRLCLLRLRQDLTGPKPGWRCPSCPRCKRWCLAIGCAVAASLVPGGASSLVDVCSLLCLLASEKALRKGCGPSAGAPSAREPLASLRHLLPQLCQGARRMAEATVEAFSERPVLLLVRLSSGPRCDTCRKRCQ
mmetsp:Transcript_34547/g.88641  ORF Transcript_34547/g.88641 Transcript_34547/m.88641 type:complete len:253 (-) Transcript_34547:443-1201(-)